MRWLGMTLSILRQPSRAPAVLALALSSLVLAAPAAAQDAYTQHQLGVLEAQQQMDRYRGVAQQNELNALSYQVEAERALQDLRRQRAAPTIVPAQPWASPVGAPEEVRIPDERLAASRARVRAILAGDRR
jgi:hypothetical protein